MTEPLNHVERTQFIALAVQKGQLGPDAAAALPDEDLLLLAEMPARPKRNIFEDTPFADLQAACRKIMRSSYLP